MGSKERGFTLIEMVVTIAIIAIVAGIGVPSYQSFVRNSRVSTITEEMVISLMLAKTEATMRGQEVTITAVNDSWLKGWKVETAGGETLRVVNAFSGVDSASDASQISFKPRLQAGDKSTIEFCTAGANKRTITIESFGAIQSSKESTAAQSCE